MSKPYKSTVELKRKIIKFKRGFRRLVDSGCRNYKVLGKQYRRWEKVEAELIKRGERLTRDKVDR